MANISDSISNACVGLLNGQGLNLTGANTTLNTLTSAPLISQALIAITAQATASTLGSTTLPGLTGVVPSSLSSIGSGKGIPFFTTQSNKISASGDISSFFQNLSQIQSYSSLGSSYATSIAASLANTASGFTTSVNKNTLAYSVTGGFNLLLTTPTKENLAVLATDLTALGTLYDLTDLVNLGLPGQLLSALLAQNIPSAITVQNSLQASGLTSANYLNPIYQASIQTALQTINKVSDLTSIFAAFSITLNTTQITNMANFCQPQTCMPNAGTLLSTSANTFTNMGVVLQGVGLSPSILTFINIGTNITSILYPANYDTNYTTNNSVTATTQSSLISAVGAGTAPGGTISVMDILGMIDPQTIGGFVTTQISNLTSLAATTDGIALNTLFVQLQTSTTLTVPSTATLITSINTALNNLLTSNALSGQYARAANAAWVSIMTLLSTSLTGVSNAGISLTSTSAGNKTTILAVAQSLPGFGSDPQQLGIGQLLSDLCTTDSSGTAIQTALNAGINTTNQ